mmetsp:Transcript_15268/g.34206  ORF Transcript_15268/g.34206 Transcript_15268/m.34206 type:complete len:133 (+) Transcript_15268:347-745(+)
MLLLEYLISVHKGNNLAPLLFVLMYQTAIELLDIAYPLLLQIFANTKASAPYREPTGQSPSAGMDFSFPILSTLTMKASLQITTILPNMHRLLLEKIAYIPLNFLEYQFETLFNIEHILLPTFDQTHPLFIY